MTPDFHTALDQAFGFEGFDAPAGTLVARRPCPPNVKIINGAPHQALNRNVRFPGITLAAAELGVTRVHLWQVLSGKRDSKPLLARWKAWLKQHPEFARLQRRTP